MMTGVTHITVGQIIIGSLFNEPMRVETVARFLREAAEFVPLTLKTIPSVPHAFEPARTPSILRRYEKEDSPPYGGEHG